MKKDKKLDISCSGWYVFVMSNAGTTKREPFIDLSRLVAIFIIIVGHANELNRIPNLASPLLNIIAGMLRYSIIVFFFFVLAGYFAKPCETHFNIRRTVDIFVPFVLYCVIGCVISEGLKWYYEIPSHSLDWSVLLTSMGSIFSVDTPGNPFLWFLKVLMVWVFISPILLRMRWETLLGVGILLYSGSVYLEGKNALPFFIQSKALYSGLFFVVGIFLRKFLTLEQLSRCLDRIYMPVFLLLTTLSVLHILKVIPHGWACIPFIGTSLMCLYTFCLAKFALKVAPRMSTFVSQFGKCTFFVYAIHYSLLDICWTYFTHHSIHKHVYGLLPFFFMVVSIALFYVIRRFMPRWSPYLLLLPIPAKRDNKNC